MSAAWKRRVLRRLSKVWVLGGEIIYLSVSVVFSIDDILADSDSDLPEDMDEDDTPAHDKSKSKKDRDTFIREDPEDIVDLADIKSIGNVLSKTWQMVGFLLPMLICCLVFL